jgi:hypothetical protein
MFEIKSGVVFAGENPGMTLYRPESDVVVAKVSLWRCVYSEFGAGSVLIAWVEPDELVLDGLPNRMILTDNLPLAYFAWDTFTRHFPEFEGYDLSDVNPKHARFSSESDARWFFRSTANTGDAMFEAAWWDVMGYTLRTRADWDLGGHRMDLSTVIGPCASGAFRINSRPVAGEVRTDRTGEQPSSSAFLAFAETWRERVGTSGT